MQLLKIVCNHFVLFQEFKTWQEIKTKFLDLKQNKKEYTYITTELMSTFLLYFILFFKVSVNYRTLAGTSCWIKVQLKIKTSHFIKIQKNKLN